MAKDQLESEKEITQERAEQLKLLEKMTELEEKTEESYKKRIANLEKEISYEKERIKNIGDEKEKIEATTILLEKEIEIAKQRIALQREELKNTYSKYEIEGKAQGLSEEEVQSFKNLYEEEKKEIEILIERLRIQEKELALRKQSERAIDNLGRSTRNIIGIFTGISDQWKETWVGSLVIASNVAGGMGAALAKVGSTIKETITFSNIAGAGLMKIQEATIKFALAQDEALASFNRATGAAGEYNSVITEVGKENIHLGIDTKEAAEATKSLFESMTSFSTLGKEAQKDLIKFTAEMNKFGISNEVVAKNLEISTKMLGMTTDGAVEGQKQIAATARTLGISTTKMAADFSSAAPRLAAFGNKAIEKFRELSVVAKQTGLELDSLLGLVEQFDTFEGAANAVGKLNAILGGAFLDSMQMVQVTDPTERFKMLRESVENAGLSYNTMSYYQRKAIASAMGLKGPHELQQLLTGDLEKNAAAAEANAMSQEQMALAVQKAQSVQEMLTHAVNMFVISMEPVVRALRWIIGAIMELNDWMGGALIPTLVLGALAFASLSKIMSIGAGISRVWNALKTVSISKIWASVFAKKAETQATNQLNTAQKTQATSMENTGKVAGKSALSMVAFGAAVLMIGAGIFLAVYGLSLLAEQMAKMTGEQIIGMVAMFTLLIAGIVALAFVAPAASIAILPLVAVMATLGVGLLLVAMAIAIVAKSLATIANIGDSLMNAGRGIKEIAAGIAAMPIFKTITFVTSMRTLEEVGPGLARFSEVTTRLKPETIEITKKLVDQAERYKEISETSKATITEPLHQLLTAIVAPATKPGIPAGGFGELGKREIVIKLDDRELKRFTVNLLDEHIKKAVRGRT